MQRTTSNMSEWDILRSVHCIMADQCVDGKLQLNFCSVSGRSTIQLYSCSEVVVTGVGEVVAGTGEQCPPFDEARCGDGRKATEAQLLGPKGINTHKRNSM